VAIITIINEELDSFMAQVEIPLSMAAIVQNHAISSFELICNAGNPLRLGIRAIEYCLMLPSSQLFANHFHKMVEKY
jgi:hypothetical protein